MSEKALPEGFQLRDASEAATASFSARSPFRQSAAEPSTTRLDMCHRVPWKDGESAVIGQTGKCTFATSAFYGSRPVVSRRTARNPACQVHKRRVVERISLKEAAMITIKTILCPV